MTIRTAPAPARRFRLTDRRPGPRIARTDETLADGWTTTVVMLEAAALASLASGDHGFTYASVVDCARSVMLDNGLQYLGVTGRPERYKDDAERLVAGRFGDFLRSGIFEVMGEAA